MIEFITKWDSFWYGKELLGLLSSISLFALYVVLDKIVLKIKLRTNIRQSHS